MWWKLLLVICVVAAFNVGAHAESAAVSDDEPRHRQKRNLIQFGAMILTVLLRNPLDYNNYGCYCGWGGSGTPVDNIDTCCQTHDHCYDTVSSSWPKITTYAYSASKGTVTCEDPLGSDARAVCECDRAATLCFYKYDDEYTKKESCPRLALQAPEQLADGSSTSGQCPVDVIFLMDGSWSISREGFETAKDYISHIVGCFNNDTDIYVGVIQYECTPKVCIPLDSYVDILGLQNAILSDVNFSGGRGRIGVAMRYTISVTQFREQARKVVVVATDGSRQAQELAHDREVYDEYAKKAKDAGIELWAIATGRELFINETALAIISDDPSRVVNLDLDHPCHVAAMIEQCEPEEGMEDVIQSPDPDSGGILPEFKQLLNASAGGVYTISPNCSVNISKDGSLRVLTSHPDFCLTVRLLLSSILPDLSLDAFRVAPALLDVAVSHSFVNTSKKELSVVGGSITPTTIVPSAITLNDFAVNVTYTKDKSFYALFNGTWSIGDVQMVTTLEKLPNDTSGIIAHAYSHDDLPVGSLIEKFGVSFLPTGGLKDTLTNAGFDSFSIADPSVSIVLGDEWSVDLSGTAVVNTWQSSVEVIVGKVGGDLVMAAAITLSSIGIVPAVKGLTGNAIDISVIPGASILSNAQVGFVITPSPLPPHQNLTISSPLFANVNIVEGVNIAASLTLPTDCGQDAFCQVTKRLLGADIELKLLASVTTTSELHMKAVVGTPITISEGIVMENVGFEVDVGTTDEIGITGSLQLETPPLLLTGIIGIKESGVFLQMSAQGMWNKAFGLDFLSIGNINLEVSIVPEPTVISSLEFGGQAVIGYQNDSNATPIEGEVNVGVDIVDPEQNYCSGSVSALTIPSILRAFGKEIDLPSFLEKVGFPQGATFSFSELIQTLPSGVTIQQGFFFSGTMEILFFNVTADLKLDSSSVFANVTVTPFTIGNDLIQVSGSGSNTGPMVFVNVSWAPIHADIRIDASVNVLDIDDSTTISMNSTGTHFSIEGSFLNLFEASLEIDAAYGSLKEADFNATGTFKSDLLSALEQKVVGALNNTMHDADSALQNAKDDVASKQQDCDNARGPFNSAASDVQSKQATLDSANSDLESKKADLQAKQDDLDQKVQALNDKQAECDKDCGTFDLICKGKVAACKLELEPLKLAEEAAEKALDIPKAALSAAEGVVDTAKGALEAAQVVLNKTGDAVHAACDLALKAAEDALTAAQEVGDFAAKLAEKVVGDLLGAVDIQEMGFSVELAVAKTGHFDGWMVVSFFHGTPERHDISFQLLAIDDMVHDIVDMVKSAVGL